MVNRIAPRPVLDVEDLRIRVQAVLDEVLDHQRRVVAEVSTDCLPLVDAVAERAAEARGEPVQDFEGRMPSVCMAGCCPNLRAARPAHCGRD